MTQKITLLKSEYDALMQTSQSYGALRDATKDICLPICHYFGENSEIGLKNEVSIVVSTRPVPIQELAENGQIVTDGALRIKEKGKLGRLAENTTEAGQDLLEQWKIDFRSDLDEFAKSEAQIFCAPEFGCPYGLKFTKTLALPEAEFPVRDLSAIATGRFVCLGTSHRKFEEFQRATDLPQMRHENVAVTFPWGLGDSVEARSIFEQKIGHLDIPENMDVNSTITGRVRLDLDHADETLRVNERDELHLSEISSRVSRPRLSYAKDVFDFRDSLVEDRSPPFYSFKKSPARKLGEYLDSTGLLKFDIFYTPIGAIAVLVCYDAYDPDIFLSAVRLFRQSEDTDSRFVHGKVDIFLVPSFNKSRKLVEMCRRLSQETESVVVYLSGDPRCSTRKRIFFSGYDGEVLKRSISNDDENASAHFSQVGIGKGGHLTKFTFSRELMQFATSAMGGVTHRNYRRQEKDPNRRQGPSSLR